MMNLKVTNGYFSINKDNNSECKESIRDSNNKDKNSENENIDNKEIDISKLYFFRTMLAFSHHFYFYYYTENEEIDNILSNLWMIKEDFVYDEIDINKELKNLNEIIVNGKGKIRKINGRIPKDVIDALKAKNVRFSYGCKTDNGKEYNIIELSIDNNQEKKDINELYSEHESDKLKNSLYCVSPMFYSGAMARVEKVDVNNIYGNESVYNYCFHLSTVTYATHLGFKDPRMNHYTNIGSFFKDEERNELKKKIVKNQNFKKN